MSHRRTSFTAASVSITALLLTSCGTTEDDEQPGTAESPQPAQTETETETAEPSPTSEEAPADEDDEEATPTDEDAEDEQDQGPEDPSLNDEPDEEENGGNEEPDGDFVEPDEFNESPYASGGQEDRRGVIDSVEMGAHDGFDRIVFNLYEYDPSSENIPAWSAKVESTGEGVGELTIVFDYTQSDSEEESTSGEQSFGSGTLLIDSYDPDETQFNPDMEITAVLDFTSDEYSAFRIFELDDPARIVIDAERTN